MAEARTGSVIGRAVPRLEDRDLVSGKGTYLDDLQPGGCLAAAFLRSPYAHARFSQVDAGAALAMPGVKAVYCAETIAPLLSENRLAVGLPSAAIAFAADRPILADEEVAHVGEPVALVVAESRAIAEDAAEAIEVDFEPLPVVGDCLAALEDGAAKVHSSYPHNCLARFRFAFGDTDAAFANAAHRVSERYEVHRGGAHSLEGRGVLAMPDQLTKRMTVWSSTQTPQALKRKLCALLGLGDRQLRVITPELGGGFGPKLVTYPEEIAIAAVARALDAPVKWVEDRQEHFLAATQERDQVWNMELAVDAGGRFLGVRGILVHDHGAYTARGLNIPYGSGVTLPLPYNIGAYALDVSVALTNKVPVAPIRGAGQPQAAFVMERLIDRAAAVAGLDRSEIRARNLVRPDQMPCRKPLKLRGGNAIVLDSGDYPATQAAALSRAGWDGFAEVKRKARAQGRCLGIGLANYVEATGRGPYETVHVEIGGDGFIDVTTGATAMGQGTKTMIAQIVAEQLGGAVAHVRVVTGDTDNRLGFGGFNSRQTVTAGTSAHRAALAVRQKMLALAGDLLEAAAEDLHVADGRVEISGVPERHVTFADLSAAAAGLPGYRLRGSGLPGLAATEQVIIDDMAFSNGTAVAKVDLDPETGSVCVLELLLAHDCGTMINPAMVDGQIVGGMAHGLGNALFEQMLFDDQAQPVSTTFADYLLISAAEMRDVDILHLNSPSPLNPLGVKGVGESGVIPAAAAICSAIDDALSHLDLHMRRSPVPPQLLRALIVEAEKQREGQAHA